MKQNGNRSFSNHSSNRNTQSLSDVTGGCSAVWRSHLSHLLLGLLKPFFRKGPDRGKRCQTLPKECGLQLRSALGAKSKVLYLKALALSTSSVDGRWMNVFFFVDFDGSSKSPIAQQKCSFICNKAIHHSSGTQHTHLKFFLNPGEFYGRTVRSCSTNYILTTSFRSCFLTFFDSWTTRHTTFNEQVYEIMFYSQNLPKQTPSHPRSEPQNLLANPSTPSPAWGPPPGPPRFGAWLAGQRLGQSSMVTKAWRWQPNAFTQRVYCFAKAFIVHSSREYHIIS